MSQCPDVPTAICIEVLVSQLHLLSAMALLSTSEAGARAAGAGCLPGCRHRAGAGGGGVYVVTGEGRGGRQIYCNLHGCLCIHMCVHR